MKYWDGGQLCGTLSTRNAGGAQRMPDKESFNCIIEDGGMNEPVYMSDRKGHNGITEDGTATTLNAQEKERPVVGASVVRRLTETECERLQGFPDGWSDIGEWSDGCGKAKQTSASGRYRLQGNSIARPFWSWLMKRISAQYEGTPTLGSLFDGQGGFPLCWAEINGPRSCRWSSEIEPFAVAVVKRRFGDEDAGTEGDVYDFLRRTR